MVLCGRCKAEIEQHQSVGGAGTLGRAALFGLGGALAGAALYYIVRAVTGYELGLIAIVVGYMVGWAMQRGAGGRGGRRYQLVAVALTYLAIGSSYVPHLFEAAASADVAEMAADSVATSTGDASAEDPAGITAASAASDSSSVSSSVSNSPPSAAGIAIGLAGILLLSLALPLLSGFAELPSSLIGLVIVAIALHQAWKMTGATRITVTGPYQVGGTPPGTVDRG